MPIFLRVLQCHIESYERNMVYIHIDANKLTTLTILYYDLHLI